MYVNHKDIIFGLTIPKKKVHFKTVFGRIYRVEENFGTSLTFHHMRRRLRKRVVRYYQLSRREVLEQKRSKVYNMRRVNFLKSSRE